MVPAPLITGGGRRLLLAGFGGLVLLILVAGTDALLVLGEVRARDVQVRNAYFQRSRALDEIRAGIYQSAIVLRDYLLAADPQVATAQLEWSTIRQKTDAGISAFAVAVEPVEAAPFRTLRLEIEAYWNVLDFMAGTQSKNTKKRGAAYFSGDLARRRTAMLELVDRIDQISASELSSGDAKLNATFDRLRLRLFMMLLITLGAGLLLAAFTIRRTLALENELKKRYDEGLRAQQELKQLSASLVSAQEEERRAISRELHDEVGQSLSALLMEAGNAAASVPADSSEASSEVRRHVESIKKLAEASVNIIRNMTLLLRPSMLDDFGLVPALEWQAREVSKRTGLRVQVAAEDASDELPDEVRTCIYRIVQEALHNCARHAQARTVKVVVKQERKKIVLSVEDDGHGFDARRVRGLGLVGMEERVTHLGGAFEIDSKPGAGTRVAVELPIAS